MELEEQQIKNSVTFIPVICISERALRPGQIKIGKNYLIDRFSIWIDADGDAFADIFDEEQKYIGHLALSYFSSL